MARTEVAPRPSLSTRWPRASVASCQDRTDLLTAIGHDLRTPITRLKLRAEFVEDEEQRAKILADLGELEELVSATLAFGRDMPHHGAGCRRSIWPELLRTILDEAADAWPDRRTAALRGAGPRHRPRRPLWLKRVLVNLISNAIHYGGSARVRLQRAMPARS